MAANDFAAQNGTEKLSTNALATVNGTNIAADLIEVQRMKVGFGIDGALRDVDAANGLPVVLVSNALVSAANSTAANLGVSGVFTGTSEDISEYSTIMVTIFADQASAVDGLQMQQSSNGTNWDLSDTFSIPALTGKTFSSGVQARFFRLVYSNGAVATTALRVQTIFSKAAKKNSSVRPQDGRTNDNDFEEVLAGLLGFNGVSFDRLRSTIANGLAVDVTRLAAPAITKNTQGATGFTTQDLKDAGRSRVAVTFMAVAPAVADTLLNLIKVTNGVAAAGATSIGVTAGKTLRINSITFSIRANAAAAAFGTLTLRQNPAGATVLASVAEARLDVGNTAATIGASDKVEVIFPDGMEFSGTQTFGLSLAAQAITNIISISINGFEY